MRNAAGIALYGVVLWCVVLWCVVFGTLVQGAPLGDVIVERHIDEPRGFGHFLGESLERRITVSVRHPYRLDLMHLPKAGRVDRWFFAKAPEVTAESGADAMRYSIVLRYQLINIVAEIPRVILPALTLHFSDGQGQFTTPILSAPIRVVTISDTTRRDLRDDQPPRARASCSLLWPLVFALITLGGAFGVLRHSAWWQHRVRREPFAEAVAVLRRRRSEGLDAVAYRRIVHNAFDRSLGKTLWVDRLEEFFDRQPCLRSQRASIEAFYADSERLFYVPEGDRLDSSPSVGGLIDFCQRLARAQRQCARGH